jgi:hypothetical protein
MMGKMAEEKKKEKLICHNCGKEIKPDEPKKKEDSTYVHQYEKGAGPRSEICEFC